jgi:hypothetical protein
MSTCLHDCAELGTHRDCDVHMDRVTSDRPTTTHLTREDWFKEHRLNIARRDAIDAGLAWVKRWNVLGPDKDSVHRDLYVALKEVEALRGR